MKSRRRVKLRRSSGTRCFAMKDFITVAISLVALLLSVLTFLRTRRIDRLSARQTLIDKKYAALTKEGEYQNQMFRLLIRVIAIKPESELVAALRTALTDQLQVARERSKRLSELNIDRPDDEVDLAFRERLGLLSEAMTHLTGIEAKVEALEEIARSNAKRHIIGGEQIVGREPR